MFTVRMGKAGQVALVESDARLFAVRMRMGVHVRSHNGLKTAALLGLLTAMILGVGYWFGGSTGLVIAVQTSPKVLPGRSAASPAS